MSRIAKLFGITVLTLFTVTACGGVEPEESERGTFQLPQGAGKADGNFTCEGSCGDIAAGGCWCDAQCAFHGDCCPDVNEVCIETDDSEDPNEPTNPDDSADDLTDPDDSSNGDDSSDGDDWSEPQPTPTPCQGLCNLNAYCSDYCPHGASCTQISESGSTYWLITSCGAYDYGDGFYWF